MPTHDLVLAGRDVVAEGTTAFRFAKPPGFAFLPGQCVDMMLLEPPANDPAGNLRTFSIASAPHEDELVFVTRMRDTPFKRALGALPIGSTVRASDPQGELTLDDSDDRPVVLLAGGIGITPFRSMLRDAARRGAAREIALIYGNRTPQATAFREELDALARELPGFSVVHCMSEPHKADPAWSGETGFISASLLQRHLGDVTTPIYYVVGPPAMTAAMRDTLMNLGIDDDAVRVEEFAGY